MLSIVTFNINGGKKLLDSFFKTNIKNKSDEHENIKISRHNKSKINPDLIFLQEFSFKKDDIFNLDDKYSCEIHFLDNIKEKKKCERFLKIFNKHNNISIKDKKLCIQSYKYNNYIVFFGIYVGQYKVYNYEFLKYNDKKSYNNYYFSTHLVSLINENINITKVHFFIINIRPLIGIEINNIIYLNLHMLSTKDLDKQKDILNKLVKYLKDKKKQFFIIGDFNMNLCNSDVKNYFSNELKVNYIEPKSFTHKTSQNKIDYVIYSQNIKDKLINQELKNLRDINDHIPQYFYKDLSEKDRKILGDKTNTSGGYYLKYLKYKKKYDNLKCKYNFDIRNINYYINFNNKNLRINIPIFDKNIEKLQNFLIDNIQNIYKLSDITYNTTNIKYEQYKCDIKNLEYNFKLDTQTTVNKKIYKNTWIYIDWYLYTEYVKTLNVKRINMESYEIQNMTYSNNDFYVMIPHNEKFIDPENQDCINYKENMTFFISILDESINSLYDFTHIHLDNLNNMKKNVIKWFIENHKNKCQDFNENFIRIYKLFPGLEYPYPFFIVDYKDPDKPFYTRIVDYEKMLFLDEIIEILEIKENMKTYFTKIYINCNHPLFIFAKNKFM